MLVSPSVSLRALREGERCHLYITTFLLLSTTWIYMALIFVGVVRVVMIN